MSPADLKAFLAQAFPDLDTTEFEVEAVRADGVDLRLRVEPKHLRPGGTVSGPTLMTLADTATYLALVARRGLEAAPAVTTSLTMQFLRRPPHRQTAHRQLPRSYPELGQPPGRVRVRLLYR